MKVAGSVGLDGVEAGGGRAWKAETNGRRHTSGMEEVLMRERSSPASELTHLSEGGARMVNVGDKATTVRTARAEAWVQVGPRIAALLRTTGQIDKGGVLEAARIAGIMAAKRTAELIPMCHPLLLESIEVEAELVGDQVRLSSSVRSEAKTGVEMEALTAAAVAALTVYDMVKSADKGVTIESIRLLEKSGGKSGYWRREENADRTG